MLVKCTGYVEQEHVFLKINTANLINGLKGVSSFGQKLAKQNDDVARKTELKLSVCEE